MPSSFEFAPPYKFEIEVRERELIVRPREAGFAAIYFKAAGQPQLILRESQPYRRLRNACRCVAGSSRQGARWDDLVGVNPVRQPVSHEADVVARDTSTRKSRFGAGLSPRRRRC
jgi:hypothetical protein